MKGLMVLEHNNQRVLTTQQLAQSYGTDVKRISDNFTANKSRYTESVHFYCLTGQELKDFKSISGNSGIASNVGKLYLWTEKGAFLHAKSLGTDLAWELYEKLVDTYFRVRDGLIAVDTSKLSANLQAFNLLFNAMAASELKIQALEEKQDVLQMQVDQTNAELESSKNTMNALVDTLATRSGNWKKNMRDMVSRIAESSGVKHEDIWHELHNRLEQTAHCALGARLNWAKKRLRDNGNLKAAEKFNKLDVIEQDPKLKEIFDRIVGESYVKATTKAAAGKQSPAATH